MKRTEQKDFISCWWTTIYRQAQSYIKKLFDDSSGNLFLISGKRTFLRRF